MGPNNKQWEQQSTVRFIASQTGPCYKQLFGHVQPITDWSMLLTLSTVRSCSTYQWLVPMLQTLSAAVIVMFNSWMILKVCLHENWNHYFCVNFAIICRYLITVLNFIFILLFYGTVVVSHRAIPSTLGKDFITVMLCSLMHIMISAMSSNGKWVQQMLIFERLWSS